MAACAFLFALCIACGAQDPGSGDIEASLLDEIRRDVGCANDSTFCDALDRFESGGLPTETATAYSRVGVGRSTFTRLETVRYLLVEPGERMLVGEVIANSPEEGRQLEEAVALLRAGGSLPEDSPIAAFVRGLTTSSATPPDVTQVTGRSRHTGTGNYDLWVRQSGEELIAITRDGTGTMITFYAH